MIIKTKSITKLIYLFTNYYLQVYRPQNIGGPQNIGLGNGYCSNHYYCQVGEKHVKCLLLSLMMDAGD